MNEEVQPKGISAAVLFNILIWGFALTLFAELFLINHHFDTEVHASYVDCIPNWAGDGKTRVSGNASRGLGVQRGNGVVLAYGSQVKYATTDAFGSYVATFSASKAGTARVLEVLIPNDDGTMTPVATELGSAQCGSEDGDDQ